MSTNSGSNFGSNPGYRSKASAMKLAPFGFAKKDEDSHDAQITKQQGGFVVNNGSYLEKAGLNLKGGAQLGDMGVESSHTSKASIDPNNMSKEFSHMSLSDDASANMSKNYTTPQTQGSDDFVAPASKTGQNRYGGGQKAPLMQQKQGAAGMENPSNAGSIPSWNGQNKSQEEKKEENDKNEVKLEDLKYVGDLGSGSQGHVKKMIHKPTQTPIALKVVDLHTEENFLKALKTEISTLQDCNSDYIVKCYGAYLTGGSISIALEYMDKGTLADILKKAGVISEPILGMITYQVLKGMEYLHRRMRVIHRDIKPSNLLINSEGQVKIADFGVSGKIDFTLQYKSTWVGTLPYMSPERCRGEKYNFDTDLWSLGLTILECALGKYPYSEVGSQSQLTFFDLVELLSSKPAPALPAGSSQELKDFVSICLRKEANTRTSATELLKHDFVKKYSALKVDKFKGWLGTF